MSAEVNVHRPSILPPWRQATATVATLAGPQGSVRRPIAFLVLAFIIADIVAPNFAAVSNLKALLVSSSFLVVVSVGEAFVILVGSIDLGVESMLSSFAMLAGFLIVLHGMPSAVGLALTFLAALTLGLLVGMLVTRMHIPSFIVTLGTFWGMQGIALLLNGGSYISPESVTPARDFGIAGLDANFAGLSVLVWTALAVVIIAQLAISYTPVGMRLKSIGSNELSARRVGLSVSALKMSVFAISALLAALAGLMATAWQGSIYPNTGAGDSLQAIAAVILGGIPFTGGRGTIVGAALGALVIGLINDVIVLLGLPSLWEFIFVALVLVAAGLQARGGLLTK
jgi:ribose/xylose/arabinose/galactoside ABC-type transport system permease subunit